MPNFYEFFAGGGMARAGLGPGWNCLFANDFDQKKSRSYRLNWGQDAPLETCDIRRVESLDLPGVAELIWASFPCQDLSLAGAGAGLKGERSGTFWPFWGIMRSLRKEGRPPQTVVLENVCGTLTSHGGRDFSTICEALSEAGYRFGAVVIDASLFVPQSRPRLFIIAVDKTIPIPDALNARWRTMLWHNRALVSAFARLPGSLQENWIWWAIPEPGRRKTTFAELIEDNPRSIHWHTSEETRRLLALMSHLNRAKVETAKQAGRRMVGTIYKRTRRDENGFKVQRAEVRFDDVAGCLRTPAGGSSRQLIMVVDGDCVRSRLISTRETARLMGLPESYKLPENYNEAYHLTGDGVVVPVVRHLAAHVLEPIMSAAVPDTQEAA
jgi:DNA (cytosine-5)-methyltransferase 1